MTETMFGKDITGRIHIARQKQFCVKCSEIKIGQIYMRFEAFVLQKHCIHIECYAEDNETPFYVATNNVPMWNANIVRIDPAKIKEGLIKIQKSRPNGKLRDL